MTRRYSSTAQATTLAAACTSAATSIQVVATTGFPAVDFVLALDFGAAGQELVLVTNVAGTTLTVTRGYNSTPAAAHPLGAAVRHVHAAQDFTDSRTHEAATTGVHGVAGAVVGTTDTQALSNKDLSSGTNIFPAALATDAEVATAAATAATNLSAHAALTATHGATGAVVGTTNSQTLTNKNLTSTTNSLPAYVSPIGSITLFAAAAAPTGWLVCDGSAVSRTTYATLFGVIGTTYGAGDGSTTFNLPNLKGRVPVGLDAAQTEFDVLGETGGEKTHVLTTSEMPSHSHTATVGGAQATGGTTSASATAGGAFFAATGTVTSIVIGNTGGDGAHNNLQPYIALQYIVRAA